VESVEYLADAGAQARVSARAIRSEDGQLELRCDASGSITDLFVRLPAPGATEVVLAPELRDRFIVLAVQDGGLLEIGVSGLRKADARTVESCIDDAGLAAQLRDRWTLGGSVGVCRILDEPRTASDDTHAIVYRRASTVGSIQPVAGVQVRLADGQYEVGWPAYLLGDYNQDGEVSLADIAPLAMLFGLRPGGPGSLTLPDAVKRVDGSGDGEINLGDIATIAQNFKNTNLSFRVERSTGDASGPGQEWESVGEAPRSAVTKTGEAVTAVSRAAYQRFREAVKPGWTYYRVVALSDSAPEAAPSESMLAPDGTPPAFSGDVGLTGGFDPVNGYVFTFDHSATDDRGGAVTWAMQLSGGGDPDQVPIMWEFADGTSFFPVVSPFSLLLPSGDTFRFVQDAQYYVRLRIADEGKNSACSDWYGFKADYGDAASTYFDIDEDSLVLWVNRQGTVRFTPPLSGVFRGLSPQIRIYAKAVPWYTNTFAYDHDTSGYAEVTPIEYVSGEVSLADMLHPGEALFILICYEGWGGGYSDVFRSVQFPYYWFAPFSDSASPAGGTVSSPSQIHYLSDGTPFQTIGVKSEQSYGSYIALYRGGTPRLYSLEGVDLDTSDMPEDYPVAQTIQSTGELILFGIPSSKTDEKSVYWWSPADGVTSQGSIPTGLFRNDLGLQDTLLEWQPLDADTLLAVRSHVQTQGDGTKVIEVWQAERGMGISLCATYPVPADAPHLEDGSLLYLDQIANGRELVILEHWSEGFMGSFANYYHIIDPDGDWKICDMNEMPENSGPWVFWPEVYINYYECRVAKDLTAFAKVKGFADATLMEKGDTYSGLFRGRLTGGLESFVRVRAYCTQPGMPDAITAPHTYMHDLIPPFDGTATWHQEVVHVGVYSRFRSCLIDGQGQILAVYDGEDETGNFYRLFRYYTRQGLMPGLANALLSDDGEWLAVGKEGAYGIAYWNTSQ